MSGEYFGRLIATGEWGICLLSSCKVRYPQNKNIFKKSSKVRYCSNLFEYMLDIIQQIGILIKFRF